MLTQRCSVCHSLPNEKPEHGTERRFAPTPPPPRLDSHSVLKACTKVPLYNMCVTKINKHSPSLSVSAPKEKVMQSLAFVPRCPPVLSLSLPRSRSAQETPPAPPPRQEAMLSQCARKAKAISIVEAMFTFLSFLF